MSVRLDERWRHETELLTRSWMQHDASMLATYLVSGVEDPRINIQSILTRHWLATALFGERFKELRYEELRFATVLGWIATLLRRRPLNEEITTLLSALEIGHDNAGGEEIPPQVLKAYQALPRVADGLTIPNYVQQALAGFLAGRSVEETVKNVFQQSWASLLEQEEAATLSVVEPGCGSANEYRFLKNFGLARFLDYTGFDLCATNIQNARGMFPEARFDVGNVLQIDAADDSFDYCFAHDLLEHLSIPAMEQAIAEMRRVTRQGICLNFFQMDEIPTHIVRPVRDYHINLLSMENVRRQFESAGLITEVIHIGTLLKMCLHCAVTHNPDAYTFCISSG